MHYKLIMHALHRKTDLPDDVGALKQVNLLTLFRLLLDEFV